MDILIEKFRRKISRVSTSFVRTAMNRIHWEARLVGIKGARGVGKTTLMLQHIKLNFVHQLDTVLYVSLDDFWFSQHSLTELADTFVKTGGTRLYLDEVHKYQQWALAIKTIYDDYPELQIVFTASSLLEILDSRADLSRRAVVYNLPGLSFREFLSIQNIGQFPSYPLEEILLDHESIAAGIADQIKPFRYFSTYLKHGYYPFFLEGTDTYFLRLEQTISMLLEIELPLLRNVDIAYSNKLKQLLSIISKSAPFIPNISKLRERIGINRQTLISYLHYLHEAKLIFTLYRNTPGIGLLSKPDKIFLDNTNLMHIFSNDSGGIEPGTIRETFFANQLNTLHELHYPERGDFLVDRKYTIEVGGKNKTRRQVTDTENAFIAADDIEYGFGSKIPLWLFGFLY